MSGNLARAGIPPFYVMDVWFAAAERQRTHGDLVNLSAGQPGADAPAPVLAAAERRCAAAHWDTASPWEYRSCAGRSHAHAATYGIDITVDEVVLTTGSSGGFLAGVPGLLRRRRPGRHRQPGYPCYRNMLSALGCEVVEIGVRSGHRFQPTTQMLDDLDPPVQGGHRGKSGQPHWYRHPAR